METTFSIQQVAELTGLSIDTLRYYERIKLLEPVSRAPSGHRQYRQRDLDWIGLLINLRETGMPLAEMHHFAELRRQGDATASERLGLLEHHQHALEQRMQKLEQHMAALQQKIAHKRAFLSQQNVAPFSTHASGEAEAKSTSPESDVSLNTQEEKEFLHGEN